MLPGKTYALGDLARACAHRWGLILLVFLAGTIAGVLGYVRVPARYRSEALIAILPGNVPSDTAGLPASTMPELLSPLTDRILSRSNLERIARDLDLHEERRADGSLGDVVRRMRSGIEVKHEDWDVLRVSYEGAQPLTAQKVTERLASLYLAGHRRPVESLVREAPPPVSSVPEDATRRTKEPEEPSSAVHQASPAEFKLLSPASLPERAANQRQRLGIVAAGSLAGLALGFIAALWLEYRDTTFKSEEDVELALALPVLASVPELHGLPQVKPRQFPGSGP